MEETKWKLVVFLPEVLSEKKNVKNSYLFGKIEHEENQSICYVTNYSTQLAGPNDCIGVVNYQKRNFSRIQNEFLNVNVNLKQVQLKSFKINEIEQKDRLYESIFLYYNSSTIFHSINFQNDDNEYVDYFRNLQDLICNHKVSSESHYVPGQKLFQYCLYFSSLFLQILNNFSFLLKLNSVYHIFLKLLITQLTCKAVCSSPKKMKNMLHVKNFLINSILDFGFGLIFLYFIFRNELEFKLYFRNFNEYVIYELQLLVNQLMSSPIGLKLNGNFTYVLNLIFSNQIYYWSIFLDTINILIMNYFQLIYLSVFFGFSFQIALLTDVFLLITFHAKLFYVWITTIYHIHINGLKSLLQLFLDRKYDPVQNRIDRHQYSNQKLFLGILTFTIAFFLLPTTLVYYIVFTSIRIVLMLLSYVAETVRSLLHDFPLYFIYLWTINSHYIMSEFFISVIQYENPVILKINIHKNSLWKTIQYFKMESFPYSKNDFCWIKFLKNILFGNFL